MARRLEDIEPRINAGERRSENKEPIFVFNPFRRPEEFGISRFPDPRSPALIRGWFLFSAVSTTNRPSAASAARSFAASCPVFGFRGIQNSLDPFDVQSQLTGLGQGTIDATNQVADAVGVAQAEGRG